MQVADVAVQVRLEAVFDAGFAGVSGPRVVGAVEPLQVFPGQGADVADGVGDGFTQRVMAHEPGLEVDAGEARPLDREGAASV